MRYTRLVPLVAAVVLALAPLTARAESAASLTLEQKREANVLNDIARCQLAAAGTLVPGKVAPSQPEAVAVCGAGVRALQVLPGAAATCPATGRSLTKFEMNQINEFEIALAKAQNKNQALPTPSADVRALLTC
ncbi:MAG TPA: hypothetical protein VK898_19490 [Chloroflexota bacterium]|nr:hypothetical protein [Chloroflexota bacterium]